MHFINIDPILPLDPLLILILIALVTIIASWCAMLSEDTVAILLVGAAFLCYAFLFNLFYRLIYQLDITTVTILTLGECGMIGIFMLIKLYWALKGGWHKFKKGQFKAEPT